MLHICYKFKHGCLLTSLTNQFVLNISQLARLMLLLRVKCSEHWLYLDVFIAVFLHLLPSWDLSPHWCWLTQIYSALLLSAPPSASTSDSHRPRWVLSLGFLTLWTLCVYMFFSITYLLLLVLFSPLPLSHSCRDQPSASSLFPALFSHFLFTLLHQKRRICIQLTGCLTDWLNEYLTGLLISVEAVCITIATWRQLPTNYMKTQRFCFDPICFGGKKQQLIFITWGIILIMFTFLFTSLHIAVCWYNDAQWNKDAVWKSWNILFMALNASPAPITPGSECPTRPPRFLFLLYKCTPWIFYWYVQFQLVWNLPNM